MIKYNFSTGKYEKDCMYEQTGLGLFIFDENIGLVQVLSSSTPCKTLQ